LNLPSNNRRAAGEDAFSPLGVVAYLVLRVDIGDINGEMSQNQVHLIGGESSHVKSQGSRVRRLCWRSSLLTPGHAFPGLPLITGFNQGVPNLLFTGLHLAPLKLAKGIQGHGKQDVLFLVDHVAHHVQYWGAIGKNALQIAGGNGSAEFLDGSANVVMQRPHHLWGALDTVALKEGEEMVLFAQVVLVDLTKGRHLVADGRAVVSLPTLISLL